MKILRDAENTKKYQSALIDENRKLQEEFDSLKQSHLNLEKDMGQRKITI